MGYNSWDNWRGVKLHETPLQDGEMAARLLSYYGTPKTHPIIVNYVSAMRDEDILCKEFKSSLMCDLTFWAVELLSLCDKGL